MSETHAHTTAFVRDAVLPQQPPPATASGPLRWMRDNLFPNWINGIMTLIAIYVIYRIVSGLLPWFISPTWDQPSLSACRALFTELGQSTHQACWGVINDRWRQLMFGFYPAELYWRPTVALFVLLAGLAPVLFGGFPRWFMAFALASPFIIFTLIWGGTIWVPIVVALGLVIAVVAFRGLVKRNAILATFAGIVLPILFWLFLVGPLTAVLSDALPIGLDPVRSNQLGGFLLSVVIGVAAIVLSLPLGILLALGRASDLFIVNKISIAFIEIVRGVPLIVWLFTASLLLNYFLPPGTSFDLTLRVIIMVTLFSAAYIAEVVRGGLAAVPKGQYEGADSLGLSYWQSMQLIVLPQALKISIPGIVNTFIGLFKDTTLVLFIGLLDPLGLTNAIRASTDWNGIYWELFIFIGVLFFVVCYSMGRYSMYLERKLQRENR
ncbi:L-glutamine ABC transporter membrane protein /L-glutamate ABC transporter membrane protein /L-aspartate ABC transporter membrane protein /L-asparagine ABC transporter membrane protein [Loktanella fryxellensis]|uniref:L-glutamine ABC transporter membrane protein /L-glutamate ABC transporter membrane protein /L-aspartate ABC transporter membrane protein /L-asparagine ABC transporter membrane protein n=1 Tax=Loktanella fryxellensis TaxID=245187 RepID=A0A1H8A4X6_9RHOB|nr:amino acid ABC transporter permease [Loktanella fryxellensis]SEM65740.1 L-glutamine ABC transporter membrane protein /L-glutamate ABC transporter membrane protein /L-aspartate ABC transporter membrane protein /L-asparagine ABC transporter membrane protein [Loktanella fryxellensis]